MTRILFFTFLLLSGINSFAQGTQAPLTPFEQFFVRYDSIFTALYKQKDAAGYERQMQTWLKEYNKVAPADRKNYQPQYRNAYYNLACTYALAGNKEAALLNLEQSIKAGYSDYSHIQSDRDFDNLRSLPQFKSLIEPLRAVGDYGFILEHAGRYNMGDDRPLPVFRYQSADDPNLQALRKGLNLDSIAGKGSDVLKVLNLLHWIHDLVPHDGNHPNPVVKNAMNMISVCRKEGRGLNCRGLATVLNECYLAMGYASRIVTCLPKDSLQIDPDCHVINMVYIPALQKWIWADPTNDAYVMNEKGELLGIGEVRERLIEHDPLILNPTANWNRKYSKTKEEYLYQYMSKNLYILQCPVYSCYDMETPSPGKQIEYIQLLPLNHFDQGADKIENKDKQGTTYTFYNTNNPVRFWQKP